MHESFLGVEQKLGRKEQLVIQNPEIAEQIVAQGQV
jgi:hypothetical protein